MSSSSSPAASGVLVRLPSSALFVGGVKATVASATQWFADRIEYDFLYPVRGKCVKMVMRFGDMRALAASRGSGGRSDVRAARGSAWVSFDVVSSLEQFAGDASAERGPSGSAYRCLIEFATPSAFGLIRDCVLPRSPALSAKWSSR
jgi:hypothetical protein